MLGLVGHARACPRFSKITNQQNLWEGLVILFISFTSMQAAVLPVPFSWIWTDMPKFLWSNKSPISLGRVVWFCWFFGSSYFHLVKYPLKLQKLPTFSGIASEPIRLSDVLNLKNSKRIWGIQLAFCFHWNLKKYYAILGYDPKILSANQFAGYFTFGLFDLLSLIPGVHCYTVPVSLCTHFREHPRCRNNNWCLPAILS